MITIAAVLLAALGPPNSVCTGDDQIRPVVRELPWAQRMLEPERAWSHSTGAGVLVAVIDSGVDGDHPQLRNKVLTGADYYQATGRGNFDCDSHGTAVASIIAATGAPGIGFHGVAPGARILPIRVAERGVTDGRTNEIDPRVLANGIRYAVWRGAKVINLSVSGHRDHRNVREAIAFAQTYDVLVVAAVGNDGVEVRPSYPAAYHGVLGVGAIDIGGRRTSGSQTGGYIDLTAPGDAVVGAGSRAGHDYWSGTSFAAPFVAGTAALVRSAWPRLTANQVAERLMATASPARGGTAPREYGAGVVDPFRAVTEGLSTAQTQQLSPVRHPVPDIAAEEIAARHRQQMNTTWSRTTAAAVGVVLLILTALVVPRGRRRRWASTRTTPPSADPERDEPPDQLFIVPPPPAEQ